MTTAGQAGEMAGMTGTMGLGLAGFVGMWTLMMAAMMLPSVAPVASMYQRSVRSWRALRLAGVHRWVPAGLGPAPASRRSCSPGWWPGWSVTTRPGRPLSRCSPPVGRTSSPR